MTFATLVGNDAVVCAATGPVGGKFAGTISHNDRLLLNTDHVYESFDVAKSAMERLAVKLKCFLTSIVHICGCKHLPVEYRDNRTNRNSHCDESTAQIA